jgi:glutathione synthase/RimK-type ligase-like ATP-grasp enzyme
MIYIYSSSHDQTTNLIIDWFIHHKVPYKRINSEDFLWYVNIVIESEEKSDIHWFWKRNRIDFCDKNYKLTPYNRQKLTEALTQEYEIIFYAFFNNCLGKVINHPLYVNVDKLTQLKIAQQCGLKIPATILTSHKSILIEFVKKHNKIVTKNINTFPILEFNDKVYQSYTSIIMEDFAQQQSQLFFPSLFQELIEKEFELRIFYIEGKCYTTAILLNQNTVDSRIAVNTYNSQMIPYLLPENIKQQIIVFMEQLNLQMGSIDMIYSKQGEYIFLEVNPSGQFMGYSESCNYQLDRIVAEYLINQQNYLYETDNKL